MKQMREIKFRVWDKVGKKMMYPQDYEVIHSSFEAIEWNWNYEQFDSGLNLPEQGEIMQYTGIKDINGKEIYEGDILENIETKDHGPVDFCYGSFHWSMSPFPVMNQEEGRFLKHKIIGNIYENLELVK
jgi:uncharacterized phage protein (TIGR01671 family)